MSNLKQELANANTTIEEKESRIDSLKKRIASLQAALNRRIQQAKQRNEKISEYESMLEELEFREKKLEKQLADLKKENKRLKGENKQLTEKKKELEETTEKQEKTITEQQDTIEKARVLSAESFSYIGINGRGKVKEKNEYKIERTVLNNGGSIKICSHVLKNPTVPKKQYDLYYVITGPDGKQIYSEQRGSGTFKFNGQNKQYTAKKNINYNQDRMKVCMQYTTPEDFKYTKGTHKVEIYWQDHLIGENEFFVSGWQPFN
jgi:myosin heavy subunit